MGMATRMSFSLINNSQGSSGDACMAEVDVKPEKIIFALNILARRVYERAQ
jgi:hypothetical protein